MNKILLIGSVAVAFALSGCATPKNNSLSVFPAYNAKHQHATVRVEGMSEPVERVKVYSFLDADATKEKPADFEHFYWEGRASYSLGAIDATIAPVSIAAEYNGGTGIEDTVRAGAMFANSLWEGNFTMAKVYPIESSGHIGMQAGLFVSQDVTDRVGVSALAEYNFKPQAVYGEAEVGVKLTDRLSAVGQVRAFIPKKSDENDIAPVVGVRYEF